MKRTGFDFIYAALRLHVTDYYGNNCAFSNRDSHPRARLYACDFILAYRAVIPVRRGCHKKFFYACE
jgi:hypothetical protein